MKITDFKAGMTVYNKINEKVTIEIIDAGIYCKHRVYARNNKTRFANWYSPDELSNTPFIKWIDLGLPSGTLWKSDIERDEKGEPIYLTFEEAKATFKENLPRPWQFTELRDECKWEWKENGYKVIGSNSNSIFLPAAGHKKKDETIHDIFYIGNYWNAIPFSKENFQYLSFSKDSILPNFLMCYKLNRLTIILCKK